MALKVLMLRSRINERQRALDALRNAADSFMSREAELAADIDAAATDEERSVIDEAIEAFEQERAANEAEQARIAGEIADYERQIGEIESAASQARSAAHGAENRGRENTMPDTATCRARILRAIGETPEQRAALVAREDVKGFLQRVRELKGESRVVEGAAPCAPGPAARWPGAARWRHKPLVQSSSRFICSIRRRIRSMSSRARCSWAEETGLGRCPPA